MRITIKIRLVIFVFLCSTKILYAQHSYRHQGDSCYHLYEKNPKNKDAIECAIKNYSLYINHFKTNPGRVEPYITERYNKLIALQQQIGDKNFEALLKQLSDFYNLLTTDYGQSTIKSLKTIEEINSKLDKLIEIGMSLNEILMIPFEKDTIKVLEDKIQRIANDATILLNKQKDELINKSIFLPFGISQFYYKEDIWKGIVFASLQGGCIAGSVYCFVEYSQNKKYANIEQDDDKRNRYLQRKEGFMWGGIGCLAGVAATYVANVIYNDKNKKKSLEGLVVIPHFSPQSSGVSLVIKF
ncbi:MAG: hypothetical protein FWC34_03740 [Bacteroidetes bacterium]|nr:hypothetical protein [Bacteroidota bacterium]MCL2303448.1 hypothetical protein [Lentimicrobiaceae bacterium]